jgi:hypothetical protein
MTTAVTHSPLSWIIAPMVARLVVGILALVILPLGVLFVVLGLVVEEPDRGRPEDFLYAGAALAPAGAALAIAFALLQRREAARRRRRRNGVRTTAEVVRARLNPNVRNRSAQALTLTVRFAAAGTADGTVSRTLFAEPSSAPTAGGLIEILYDPTDPSNFEPVLRRRIS